MNKHHLYKSLGVIESYIMFLNDKLDSTTSDYVMTHLDLLHDWIDKSCIDEKHTTPVYTHENGCKVNSGLHVYYNGKCDYCGNVKDDN